MGAREVAGWDVDTCGKVESLEVMVVSSASVAGEENRKVSGSSVLLGEGGGLGARNDRTDGGKSISKGFG